MGMEVVWIRLFTPYVGPLVYSFAMILATYLLATFFGSQIYRLWSRGNNRENSLMWVSLALFGLLEKFGRGPAGNDAKVNLGPFQPVEAIKILLVFFLAGYFAN